ncbi:hypothetical protein BpHYR1_007948 [Brachionus plicatilis]|uniref:Uncharacterized protein n=1 Tax=Brachionus plicatilis TaxID=10195 RepID=A0A3M7SM96_BRAPC|nr:hypothetical protein BpHYR1_007948 [Brachionus plicatilis]
MLLVSDKNLGKTIRYRNLPYIVQILNPEGIRFRFNKRLKNSSRIVGILPCLRREYDILSNPQTGESFLVKIGLEKIEVAGTRTEFSSPNLQPEELKNSRASKQKLIYWNKFYLSHDTWNQTRGSIFYNRIVNIIY